MFSFAPTNHVAHAGPRGVVAHGVPGLVELQPEILDDRRPEPVAVLERASEQCLEVGEPVPAHKARDVRIGERLRVRCPNHLGHGG